MNQELQHPELSIGAKLVQEHIEELEESENLSREKLEEVVEVNPRLSTEDLDGILESLSDYSESSSCFLDM